MKIYVIKQNTPIGYLEEETFNNVTFTYFEETDKLSYIPGLNNKVNLSENGLFNVFENLIPENNQIELLKSSLDSSSCIKILLHLTNVHGSFIFTSDDDLTKYNGVEHNKIINYLDAREEILCNNYKFPNILKYSLDISNDILFPKGISGAKMTGLSGYQYKFSVHVDNGRKTISYDDTESSDYIMKPYSKDGSSFNPYSTSGDYIPYLLINEHLFMTIARDLGFMVPYSAIIKNGIDFHYIIKRYDRFNDSSFDHEEFATLLGINPKRKYDPSMTDVLNISKDYLNTSDIEELFAFFYFANLISHGDFHSKNISLIHCSNDIKEKEKILSPYYDISTTKIYKGLDNRDTGMKIGNKKSNLKIIDFIKIAKLHDIDEVVAMQKIESITKYFFDNFISYIERLPDDIKELPFYYGKYSSHISLEATFNKYYNQRVDYIRNNINEEWAEEEEIF